MNINHDIGSYNYNKPPEIRDYHIVFDKNIEVIVTEPKVAKIYAEQGNSFGTKGWFVKVNFNIDGIYKHDFGSVYSSYKAIKDDFQVGSENEEIGHWVFEETRKSRKVKCNACGITIINLQAEQCSECGKYYCKECMTDSTCQNCQGED